MKQTTSVGRRLWLRLQLLGDDIDEISLMDDRVLHGIGEDVGRGGAQRALRSIQPQSQHALVPQQPHEELAILLVPVLLGRRHLLQQPRTLVTQRAIAYGVAAFYQLLHDGYRVLVVE